MTTYTPLGQSITTPFQFTATLDGDNYTVSLAWNTFGQRFFINITDQGGNLILATPLISSADASTGFPAINLVGGYFVTSTLIFRESTQQFEVAP